MTKTIIDSEYSPYSQYVTDARLTSNPKSIGRCIHYLYCICGLGMAKNATFDGNNKVKLYNEDMATIDWSKGYPHFTFIGRFTWANDSQRAALE